jgi:hypothetical protein
VTSKEAYTHCYFKEEQQRGITHEKLYSRCYNDLITLLDAVKFLILMQTYEELEREQLEEERVEHARQLSQRRQP